MSQDQGAHAVAVAMSKVIAQARAVVKTHKLLGQNAGAPLDALALVLEDLDKASTPTAIRAYLAMHFPDIGQVGRGIKGGKEARAGGQAK
jgi:hypothetical protein